MKIGFHRRWQNPPRQWWTIGILATLWVLVVAWINVSDRSDRRFAFARVAEAAALVYYADSNYPDWLAALARFDDERLRLDAVKFFDAAVESGGIPQAALPEWALLLHLLGEGARAEKALSLMRPDFLPPQKSLVASIVADEPVATKVDAWVARRAEQGEWELPEWHYAAFVQGDARVQGWLEARGENMIRRGLAAHVLAAAVLGAALVSFVWWVFRRSTLPVLPRRSGLMKGWGVRRLVVEFFLAELLGLLFAVCVAVPAYLLGFEDGVDVLAGVGVMLFPVFWLVFRLTPGWGASLRLFGLRRSRWTARALCGLGLAGVAVIALLAGLVACLEEPGESIQDTITADGLDRPLAVIWIFFLAVVLAPLSEEFVFRGFLFGGLSQRWGPVGASVASSVCFALMHGYTWTGLLVVFFYGLIFCRLFRRSGSLWPGIIAHSAVNLVITAEVVGWFSLH
ncbi:MAG: type II CAAX endopeptidase family protein [Verrucomicrobiales bacterium]